MSNTRRFLRALALAGVAGALGAGNRDYSRHTTSEVQAKLDQSAILGVAPDSVIRILRSLRFAEGDSLIVGQYVDDAGRREVEANLPNAKKTSGVTWDLNVVVVFDSLRTSRSAKADLVAINAP